MLFDGNAYFTDFSNLSDLLYVNSLMVNVPILYSLEKSLVFWCFQKV